MVLIRTSKTDKESEGQHVPVKAGRHPDTDPVAIVAGLADGAGRARRRFRPAAAGGHQA